MNQLLNDIRNNPLLLTDVYNLSHTDLKENTDYEVSHIYNRSRPMILYGINEMTNMYLNQRIEVDMIMEAEEYAKKMGLKFPTDLWMKVVEELKGWIPLHVQALPDGTWVPKGTPFVQIKNTEEGFGELVTWWEAVLLHSYFASGCATEAFWLRKYLEEKKLPLHRFHSFGFRGHHSLEDAYWAGTAWNLFLTGTDDFHTIFHTPNANIGSIPATAHKVIQQFDDEFDAFIRAIDVGATYENKIVALVIDTYDPYRIISQEVGKLITYAMTKGVHIVFRPDSGDLLEQTKLMWDLYNYADNWSMIIGEGMSREKVIEYDTALWKINFPLERMSYGIGAGFYKHIDRDWLGHAMKTSYSNGADRMKLTKSNPYKQSIPGVVNIVEEEGVLTVDYHRDGLYQDIYHYDERSTRPKTIVQTWDEIQAIALKNLEKPTLQEGIVLSPLVTTNISRFKEKYG